MTAKKLEEWYGSHCSTYRELARGCGSVPELMFRLEVFGSRWTKWDWVFFLSFLDYSADEYSKCEDPATPVSEPVDLDDAKALLADVYASIDSGSDDLAAVLTNKTVVLNLIEWAGGRPYASAGIYRVLAHVFKRFPELWKMNWMFVRHRGRNKAAVRTHRLAPALPGIRRGERYFDSDAFRQDFVHRYFSKR